MPKKKDKKKGKKKKDDKSASTTANANNPEEQERKKMVTVKKHLYLETQKEEKNYNEHQQQREKIHYFWIVAKKNLEDKKAELRNKEREMQDLEEKHQVILKRYKQRVKHLLHEYQNEKTIKKTDEEVGLKLRQDQHRELDAETKQNIRVEKLQLREEELGNRTLMLGIKHEQDRHVTELIKEFDRKSSEIRAFNEKAMEKARGQLEDRTKAEITAIEQKKNEHITQLMDTQKKAFAEIKEYYNDITHNNLDLIKSLKEVVGEMRKKEQQDEKTLEQAELEHKRMTEPFERAKTDVRKLREELEKYDSEKQELRTTKAQLLVVEDEYRNLKWANEVQIMRFEETKDQRDRLQEKMQTTVFEAQQKLGFRNLLLGKQHGSLMETLEAKEAQLSEVLSTAQAQKAERVEMLIQNKTATAYDLEKEIQMVKMSHTKLITAMHMKMKDHCIPSGEL